MHGYGVTALVLRSWHRSAGVTRPSQLILAHAPDHNPPADFGFPTSAGLCRLLQAPAGRWPFPTLSLRSLYRCLDPYPATPLRCSCPFLPGSHRPHLTTKKFGPWKIPSKQLPARLNFSRLQSFVYLQAPILARPSRCSDRWFPFGHRALYTAQNLHRCRIQAAASLRVRIRTIDTTGLGPAFAAPHLLDRSLVGCSWSPAQQFCLQSC